MLHRAGFRTPVLFVFLLVLSASARAQTVERYGVFETRITHDAAPYDNPFTGVDLNATFEAPSGKTTDFHGFYDGDGQGGNTGNVWKLRFMPEETGTYTYTWSFSDGSDRGSGSFEVTASERKPPLQVCRDNPRWLCYGGAGTPVLLKAYKPDATFTQDEAWMRPNVYQPLAQAGYNSLMLERWPSSWNDGAAWSDYSGGGPYSTPAVTNATAPLDGRVNLAVWQRVDRHIGTLNDLGIQAWSWTGFGGSNGGSVDWNFAAMSSADKEEWIQYWTARWAPFANVAWGYWYESNADDAYWTLIDRYDPWDHLTSSQWHPLGEGKAADVVLDETDAEATDWYPVSHASTWRYSDDDDPQALHDRILSDRRRQEDVAGEVMPYYTSEGANWTQQFDIDTSVEEFAGVIWASITASAYFNWNFATACNENTNCSTSDLLHGGYDTVAQTAYEVLESGVPRWYDLESRDDLLASEGEENVWALAEPGEQYLVFSLDGRDFELTLAPGAAGEAYVATWVDARTGASQSAPDVTGDGSFASFSPPSRGTDWVLVLKQPGEAQPVELNAFEAVRREEGVVLSWRTLSETDNAGFAVERRRGEDASWTQLGFVEGAGTTSVPQSYRFTDRDLPTASGRITYRLEQTDHDGTHTYSPEVAVRLATPEHLALHGNFPNPFREQTTIRYDLPRSGRVQLTVYDVRGRVVRRLVDARQEAGTHTVLLDGQGLAGGMYVCALEAAGVRATQKITLVR